MHIKPVFLHMYNMCINNISGFPIIFSHKFKVFSRLCPGQKGHSPGFSTDNLLVPKGRCQRCSKIEVPQYSGKKLSQHNNEMLYIFNIPGFIHVFCSNSWHVQVFLPFWANSRPFLDLDRYNLNLQVSRFCWEP